MTAALRGGDYLASRAADGTWTIRNVPIFANCERTITAPNGAKITAKFDRAWQEAAVGRAKSKYEASGFMRAIYPGHKTEPGKQREPLGFFLPTEVRDEVINGKKASVTYADYVGVSDAAYRELKSRKHPYKSGEAPVGTDAEFTGLAWLSEPPYHSDFPIQTVKEDRVSREVATGVVGFNADAATVAALVRFEMPDITEDDKPDAKLGEKPAAKPADAKPPEAPPEATPKPDPSGELGAKVDALTSMVVAMVGMLGKITGGMQGSDGASSRPAAVAPNANFGGAAVAETITFNAESFAALQGENAALKAKVDAHDKAEARRSALAAAGAKVKGYAGITEADLVAQFDAGGAVGLDAFVAGATKFGVKDPDNKPLGGADTRNLADPIVASFDGQEAAAAHFGAQFDSLPVSLRGGMTKEAWITTALGYDGVKVSTKGGK